MHHRISSVLVVVALVCASHASAMPECRAAGPIGAGLKKLIREFGEARPGQASSASVQDFLIGVSNIPATAESALVARGPVRILPKGAGEGDLTSDGPQALQFEGVFARKQTFFKVPQRIEAQYRVSKGTLMLAYKEGAAIALGEAVPVVGIRVYRRINHVVITPDRLLFFWDSNSGNEPDRCYIPSAS